MNVDSMQAQCVITLRYEAALRREPDLVSNLARHPHHPVVDVAVGVCDCSDCAANGGLQCQARLSQLVRELFIVQGGQSNV